MLVVDCQDFDELNPSISIRLRLLNPRPNRRILGNCGFWGIAECGIARTEFIACTEFIEVK